VWILDKSANLFANSGVRGYHFGQVRFAMAKISENRGNREDLPAVVVQDYVSSLSNEYKMLVVLKAQLYGGSWEPMLDDLNNRLAGKPYIFKLANRIKDDVERIEEMRNFEVEHGVDLAKYVHLA